MRRRAAYSIFIALVVSPLLLIGCGNSENKNGTGGSGGGTGVAGGTTKLDGGGTEGGMGGAKIDGGAVDAGGVTGTGCGADTISNVDLTSSYTGAWATSTTADGKLAGGPLIAAAPTNGSTGTGITFANWNGNFVQVTQGNTTTITFTPIALSSDTVVNTLLSNFYGGSNTQAVITFTNSNNATAVYSLVGGQTIRDYNNNTFQNGLSLTGSNSTPGLGSVTAQEWWNDGHSGMYQRLDVQTFVLPSSWNGSHLNSITIANPSDSSGSDVLSALQVRSPACAKLDAGGAPDVAPSPVDTVDAGAAGVGETSDSRVADAPIGQDAQIALDGDSGVDSAASLPTPAPDYVWYVLDETQGTTAKDSSSHHYDIANLAGVTWSEGANFDGLSGGGSVAVDSSYRTPPITISAWLTPRARADKTANSYVFQPYPTNAFGDDLPGNSGYGLGLNVWTDGTPGAALAVEDVDHCVYTGSPSTQSCTADQNVGDAGVVFEAGKEYFIAAAIGAPGTGGASSVARVYVNGALFTESTASAISGGSTTLWLGQHNDDTPYGTKRVFSGKIRDARVYKREIDAAQIAALYAAGPTTVAP
jgi:hypothetical protein